MEMEAENKLMDAQMAVINAQIELRKNKTAAKRAWIASAVIAAALAGLIVFHGEAKAMVESGVIKAAPYAKNESAYSAPSQGVTETVCKGMISPDMLNGFKDALIDDLGNLNKKSNEEEIRSHANSDDGDEATGQNVADGFMIQEGQIALGAAMRCDGHGGVLK